ncbi:MAG: DUF58 domain-containing protein [Microcella sp.]|uniref:DUF58 domain-containing protein n=1 Tax=Microcella sp. TaxID=1913979 RepID=UPI003314A626
MPRLTARGGIFLVVGVGLLALSYAVERPELLPAGAIAVAAPLVGLLVVASTRPNVVVSRRFEPSVAVQDEVVRVTTTVAGRSRSAEWVERVPMPPGFAGPGRLADVRLTRPAQFGYRYWPERRGLVEVGPLLIEDRDPFALAVRVTDTRTVTPQLVLPSVMPLPVGPVPAPVSVTGTRSARSRTRSDDDVVTREYRDGDALRRVHWRVTARQGELMVRQDEPQAGPRSRIIIDTQRSGYPDTSGRSALSSSMFEWAVRFAASVAVHLDERGYAVDLATPAPGPVDAPHADGPAGAALGELALLELGADDPHRELSATGGTLPVVVVAARPDAATVSWMLGHRTSSSAAAPALAVLVDDDPALLLPATTVSATARRDDDAASETAAQAFARAGWIVARVPPSATPAEAWHALAGVKLDALGASATREPTTVVRDA